MYVDISLNPFELTSLSSNDSNGISRTISFACFNLRLIPLICHRLQMGEFGVHFPVLIGYVDACTSYDVDPYI